MGHMARNVGCMLQRSPSVVTRLRVSATPVVIVATRWIGRAVLPLLLVVAGLGALVAAAWQYSHVLGTVAAGLGCFVLEWRLDAERAAR